MIPSPNASWLARVGSKQARQDAIFADERDLPVREYQHDALSRVQELVAGEIRIRLHDDQLAAFLDEQRWRTLFMGGRTRGLQDRESRILVEELVLGVARGCPDEGRPAYGYLQGSDEAHPFVNGWGEVVLHLREDARLRATVTFGDSLGSTHCADSAVFAASPLSNPDLHCRHAEVDVCGARELYEAVPPDVRYAEVQLYEPLGVSDIAYASYTAEMRPGADTVRLLREFDLRFMLVSQVS